MKAKKMKPLTPLRGWAIYDPTTGQLWQRGRRDCIYGERTKAVAEMHNYTNESAPSHRQRIVRVEIREHRPKRRRAAKRGEAKRG